MKKTYYIIFLDIIDDGLQRNSVPIYQIALRPFSRNGGAMITNHYPTKEAFAADIQQHLEYTDVAIERLFSKPNCNQALIHPLSDEDASHLGWYPAA
jgi:hypothetical protein